MKIRIVAIFLVIILLFTGCSSTERDTSTLSTAQDIQSTRIFVDSCGRKVELPTDIITVVPSGPLAQIVLYTICPDKLVGLSNNFSEEAKKYIDDEYWSLPKIGQFYGKNVSLNMEELIKISPDVLIDIGEAKTTIREDMNALQEQVGIPVVFIEATLSTMDKAYKMLGELTGEQDRAAMLGEYCNETTEIALKIAETIDNSNKKSVYFAIGDKGLNTNAAGSIHADVIDWVGAINVANIEAVSSGGGNEVSMEQLLVWNPGIVIVENTELYRCILNDPLWQELDAVKEGKVYKIPDSPYSVMSNPPSVNRILGIRWLGNIIYPEQYDFDIVKEFQRFYKAFYSIDLTEEKANELLNIQPYQ